MRVENSQRLFAEAQQYIPGGVDSPVRAFRAVGGTPLFIERGAGSRIFDADGNEFIDYVASWGPLILGHAHPKVVAAVKAAADQGTSFGAPTRRETVLAKMVAEAFPSIELVRFVNSGTEATMSALRLARGFTGRDKVIKFEGCYHGHADGLLVKAGSGALTLGAPDSPGVPASMAENTLSVPYNDLQATERVFEANKGQIAAVILEPVAGNMGVVPPKDGFLQGLRELTRASSSRTVGHGEPARYESEQTTHFTIADRWGNVVANTYTLNDSYGSRFTIEGAGFLMNDEMDDFAAKPGTPNRYGLVQSEANAVQPRKRPLSSMTPTIVLKDGRPWFALGSPGGGIIINAVMQVIINVVDHGMNLQQAVDAPRIHHQWLPDSLDYEPYGLAPDTRTALERMGHVFKAAPRTLGDVHAIMVEDGTGVRLGASDPRLNGWAIGY